MCLKWTLGRTDEIYLLEIDEEIRTRQQCPPGVSLKIPSNQYLGILRQWISSVILISYSMWASHVCVLMLLHTLFPGIVSWKKHQNNSSTLEWVFMTFIYRNEFLKRGFWLGRHTDGVIERCALILVFEYFCRLVCYYVDLLWTCD